MRLCSVSVLPLPSLPAVIDCPSAVTTPAAVVGVPVPPALPMATTASPTSTVDESPSGATARPEALASCSTATSSVGSVPTTVASYDAPVATTVTVIFVAPSITWLFVSTSPDAVSTMPVPAASARW